MKLVGCEEPPLSLLNPGDAGDDALDQPVEVLGVRDDRLAGDEGQHDSVDERQHGGRLIVDQWGELRETLKTLLASEAETAGD